MALFDDPEMQLIGFEQSGINNAKRNSPNLNPNTGELEIPHKNVKLSLLSGIPERGIHWNQGGIEHQDPTVFGLLKRDNEYYTRLTPEQDPQFRQLELDRTSKIYADLTPEQIRSLHYTDAASFPGTVQRDLSIQKTSLDYAIAFLERQKAIQDLRLGNRSINNLASELEKHGMRHRFWEIGKYGEEKNMEYSRNLRRYLDDAPFDKATEAYWRSRGVRDIGITPIPILPERSEIAPVSETIMAKNRQDTRALIGEWEQMTRKHGVGTEAFTEQIKNNRGPQRFNTGGFLLGALGDAGMIGRLLQGGSFMGDIENFDFDVMTPTEIKTIEAARQKGRGVYRNSEGVLEESPYQGY